MGGFFETFLEGSVDLIIYRDYIVNRRFFIYCSLACAQYYSPALRLVSLRIMLLAWLNSLRGTAPPQGDEEDSAQAG